MKVNRLCIIAVIVLLIVFSAPLPTIVSEPIKAKHCPKQAILVFEKIEYIGLLSASLIVTLTVFYSVLLAALPHMAQHLKNLRRTLVNRRQKPSRESIA